MTGKRIQHFRHVYDIPRGGKGEYVFGSAKNMRDLEVAWQELKHKIQNNQQGFIRGFGRNSNGTHLFQAFYADVLSNNQVTVDPDLYIRQSLLLLLHDR
jgi:hypothetical protein